MYIYWLAPKRMWNTYAEKFLQESIEASFSLPVASHHLYRNHLPGELFEFMYQNVEHLIFAPIYNQGSPELEPWMIRPMDMFMALKRPVWWQQINPQGESTYYQMAFTRVINPEPYENSRELQHATSADRDTQIQ